MWDEVSPSTHPKNKMELYYQPFLFSFNYDIIAVVIENFICLTFLKDVRIPCQHEVMELFTVILLLWDCVGRAFDLEEDCLLSSVLWVFKEEELKR